MKTMIALVCVGACVCALCAVCGCTDRGEEADMALVVMTTDPTPAPTTDIREGDGGWTLWREGDVTIGRLGEYQTYRPMKNGEYFHALRVGVDASGPVSLFFFTPDELVNFQTKWMTNAGDYTAVAAYEDVTAGTYTCVGESDLTVAVLNRERRPVTTAVNIWYHE